MLWVKSFHIVFVASWFAGLFYLPRIFVNLAMVPPESVAERERLLLMANKLFRFMTVLAVPALGLGFWLWLGFGDMIALGGWLHAKLLLVVLLMVHFVIAGRWLKGAGAGRAVPTSRALRWFNELPLLLFFGVVYLVLAKPFRARPRR